MKKVIAFLALIGIKFVESSFYVPWKGDNNECRPGYSFKNNRCYNITPKSSKVQAKASPKNLVIASSEAVSTFNVKTDGKLTKQGSWNVPYETTLPYVGKTSDGIEIFGDHTRKSKAHFKTDKTNTFMKVLDSGFDGRYSAAVISHRNLGIVAIGGVKNGKITRTSVIVTGVKNASKLNPNWNKNFPSLNIAKTGHYAKVYRNTIFVAGGGETIESIESLKIGHNTQISSQWEVIGKLKSTYNQVIQIYGISFFADSVLVYGGYSRNKKYASVDGYNIESGELSFQRHLLTKPVTNSVLYRVSGKLVVLGGDKSRPVCESSVLEFTNLATSFVNSRKCVDQGVGDEFVGRAVSYCVVE